MSELRECPFCGGEAYAVDDRHNACAYWVQCKACGARVWGSSRRVAVESWNTRPADAVREAAKEIAEEIRRYKPTLDGTGDANYLNVVLRAGACRSLLAALAQDGRG